MAPKEAPTSSQRIPGKAVSTPEKRSVVTPEKSASAEAEAEKSPAGERSQDFDGILEDEATPGEPGVNKTTSGTISERYPLGAGVGTCPSDPFAPKPWRWARQFTPGPQSASSHVFSHSDIGGWLFDGGTEGSVCRNLRAKSDTLRALAIVTEREESRHSQRPWISTRSADIFFGFAIMWYSVVVGVDVEIATKPILVPTWMTWTLFGLQVMFVAIFILELVLRVLGDGWKFCSPCHNLAGAFDTAIILLGTAEFVAKILSASFFTVVSVMRVVRLLRLVRIFRVLLVIKELRLLMVGMFSSLSAVFWTFVLLLVLMYNGALVCVVLLSEHESLSIYFGSVPMALFTHFTVVTLEAWPAVSDAVILADGALWAVYFMLFIMVSSMALMNLVTGVVCEKLMGSPAPVEPVANQTGSGNAIAQNLLEETVLRERLTKVMTRCDADLDSRVDAEEFRFMMVQPDMKSLLESMEITTDVDALQLFDIMDIEHKGSISFDHFNNALMRLRGSRTRLHSLMLQQDLIRGTRAELALDERLTNDLRHHTRKSIEAAGALAIEQLQALQQEALARSAAPAAKPSSRNRRASAEDDGATDCGHRSSQRSSVQSSEQSSPSSSSSSPDKNSEASEVPEERGEVDKTDAKRTSTLSGSAPAVQAREAAPDNVLGAEEAASRLEQLISELDSLRQLALGAAEPVAIVPGFSASLPSSPSLDADSFPLSSPLAGASAWSPKQRPQLTSSQTQTDGSDGLRVFVR